MKCCICQSKNARPISKNGIFLGINLEEVTIYSCSRHSRKELEIAFKKAGEREVSLLQKENPFLS